MPDAHCRICQAPLHQTFVDLGNSPLCESFLEAGQLNAVECFYPLHVWVCDQCFLVQLEEYVDPSEIFTEYAYFSSYSDWYLEQASRYVDGITGRLGLGPESLVVELASNDGYLLQYFVKKGIPVLGIEPAANVAEAARARGVETEVLFFDAEAAGELAASGRRADLIVANNVLAQVPGIRSFVAGMKTLLGPQGVVTIEVPHLIHLIREKQFDTIYHEHFSYFSLSTLVPFFASEGLVIFDVEEIPTHGGSIRIHARHAEDESKPVGSEVARLLGLEEEQGILKLDTYFQFDAKVKALKRDLLDFLIQAKRDGKRVAGYGAPGKGNTLLNYCGIRTDFIDFLVDRNPYKHGRFTPGTHIPIHPPSKVREEKPDYLLILPWNLKEEILEQEAYIREWGGRFVVPIPEVQVIP